jgi:hypothetical protein
VKKQAEALLASIMEELAACGENKGQYEAKAIFRLLNYCPPEEFPLSENQRLKSTLWLLIPAERRGRSRSVGSLS